MNATARRQPRHHRDSRARAAEAYLMHLDGYSWQDIADALRYRSRSGAQKAVDRHLAETTPDPSDIARRKWIDGKRRLRARVSRQLSAAEAAGDHQAVAQLSAAIDRTDDQIAKASGYYAAQNVNVTVAASPVEAVTQWQRQMHELASSAARPGVIDAEIVGTPREIAQ